MGSPDANARSPSVVMTVTPPSPIARQDPSDHTAAARSSMPRRITSSEGRPSSADGTHSRPNVREVR